MFNLQFYIVSYSNVYVHYRLEAHIVHLLWGLMYMFFGYNFPKPEPMWMKSGI